MKNHFGSIFPIETDDISSLLKIKDLFKVNWWEFANKDSYKCWKMEVLRDNLNYKPKSKRRKKKSKIG
jgi:hypothetical protein